MVNSVKKTAQPKGNRLNWEPLESAQTVRITSEMLVGKRLSTEDLRRNSNRNSNFRIP